MAKSCAWTRRAGPQFRDLLFHRGDPCFFAFDALMCEGKDWRTERLPDRKQELRRLLGRLPLDSRLRYVDHVDGSGTALFQWVCKLDLEGIVAKQKSAPYSQSERAAHGSRSVIG
jgi:ATP-dependent DNA ligase